MLLQLLIVVTVCLIFQATGFGLGDPCGQDYCKDQCASKAQCPQPICSREFEFCSDLDACHTDCPDGLSSCSQDTFRCMDSGNCGCKKSCSPDTVYCVARRTCTLKEDCQPQVLIPQDRQELGRPQNHHLFMAQKCPPGQIFCLKIHACVTGGHCQYFDNQTETDSCPTDSLKFPYSNCIFDDHCVSTWANITSTNMTCCSDTTGHRQCLVVNNASSAAPVSKNASLQILASVCQTFSPVWPDFLSSGNPDCTTGPESCPPGTLCCREKCYGFRHESRPHGNDSGSIIRPPKQPYECDNFTNYNACPKINLALGSCSVNQSITHINLTKVIGLDASCWIVSRVLAKNCIWESDFTKGFWQPITVGSILCSAALVRLNCSQSSGSACGLDKLHFIDVQRSQSAVTDFMPSVKRVMVVRQPAIPDSNVAQIVPVSSSANQSTISLVSSQPLKWSRVLRMVNTSSSHRPTAFLLAKELQEIGLDNFSPKSKRMAECLGSSTSSIGLHFAFEDTQPQAALLLARYSNRKAVWEKAGECFPWDPDSEFQIVSTSQQNDFGPRMVAAKIRLCATDCGANQTQQQIFLSNSSRLLFQLRPENPTIRVAKAKSTVRGPLRVSYADYLRGISCSRLANYYYEDSKGGDCSNCSLVLVFVPKAGMLQWEMSLSANSTDFSSSFVMTDLGADIQNCTHKHRLTYKGPLSEECLVGVAFNATVCPPQGRLRMRPQGSLGGASSWTLLDALKHKIIFFVSDRVQLTSKNVMNSDNCSAETCGLSSSPSIFYLEMEDCTGNTITSQDQIAVKDRCGICAGNTILCSSCQSTDAGKLCCLDDLTLKYCPSPSKPTLVKPVVIRVNQCNSSLYAAGFNQCKNCLAGKSQHEFGLNGCGRCVPLPNQDRFAFSCPSTGLLFNKRNRSQLLIEPPLVDLVMSPTLVPVKILITNFTVGNYQPLAQCTFTQVNSMTSMTANCADFGTDGLNCLLESPSVGQFNYSCQLIKRSDSRPELFRGDLPVDIVDSASIKLVSSDLNVKNDNDVTITIQVSNVPDPRLLGYLSCFYRLSQDPSVAQMIGKVMVLSKEGFVKCGPVRSLAGNDYEFGLVFLPDADKITKPNLSTVRHKLKSGSPLVTRAFYRSSDSTILIDFNDNIQLTRGCWMILDENSTRLVKETFECVVTANRLTFFTPNGDAFANGQQTLAFSEFNGIVKANSVGLFALSAPAGMPFPVRNYINFEEAFPLQIKVSDNYCYNAKVCLKVMKISYCVVSATTMVNVSQVLINVTRLQPNNNMSVWTGTFNVTNGRLATTNSSGPTTNKTAKADGKIAAERGKIKSKIKLAQQLCIPKEVQLVSGTYEIETEVRCEGGSVKRSASKSSFTVAAPSDSVVINIRHNQRIARNSHVPATLLATIDTCSNTSSLNGTNSGNNMRAKLTRRDYVWTAVNGGIDGDISSSNSQLLQIDKSSLEGGTTYNFTLQLFEEPVNYLGCPIEGPGLNKSRRNSSAVIARAFSMKNLDSPSCGVSNMSGSRIKDTLSGNQAKVMFGSTLVKIASSNLEAIIQISSSSSGTNTLVYLDASYSSDPDNAKGPLEFDWSECIYESGLPCLVVVNNGTDPIGWASTKSFAELTSPSIYIEAQSLMPGNYTFIVTISKGKRKARSNAQVQIVPTKTPTINVLASERTVESSKTNIIKALISAMPGDCFQWSSLANKPYEYLELSDINSASLTCFDQSSDVSFDLCIPSNRLKPGAVYKFKISGVSVEGSVASQSVIINSNPAPPYGHVEIQPRSGVAMSTVFKIVVDWSEHSSSSSDMFFTFGCRHVNLPEQKVRLAQTMVTADDLEAEIAVTLPLLDTANFQAIIFFEVCNSLAVCSHYELTDSMISVTVPQITTDNLRSWGEEVVNMLLSKDYYGALSSLFKVETTLIKTGQWSLYRSALCSLLFSSCARAAEDMVYRSTNDYVVRIALSFMDEFSRSSCLAFEDPSIADERRQCTSAIGHLSETILQEMRRRKKPNAIAENAKLRRRKRQVQSSECLRVDHIFEAKDLQTMLDVAGKSILNTSSAFANEINNFLSLVNNYTKSELCAVTNVNEGPATLRTNFGIVYMKKEHVGDDGQDQSIPLASARSQLDLGPPDRTKVTISDKTLQGLKEELCSQLAVFAEVHHKDIVSSSSPSPPPSLVSDILKVSLLSGDTCQEVGTDGGSGVPMKFTITILNPSLITYKNRTKRAAETVAGQISTASIGNLQLRCMVFVNNKWDSGPCTTTSITMSGNGQSAYVNCDCNVVGYIAVGLVNDNNQILQLQEVYTFQKALQFKIDNNASICLSDKNAFLFTIRQQLAKSLLTDPSNFRSIDCQAGSILVSFELTASDNLTAARLTSSYADFINTLMSGKLRLLDQNGNVLNVPSQCPDADICSPTRLSQGSMVALIAGSVALALIFFIILCLICAICIKNRKRSEKTLAIPIPAGQRTGRFPPRYREAQYAELLQGTSDSLTKYRKSTRTDSPMSPLSVVYSNMMMQGPSSILLHDEDSGLIIERKSPVFLNGRTVPLAAKYKKPSKQQMEQSYDEQTLKEMMQRERERLPATPE